MWAVTSYAQSKSDIEAIATKYPKQNKEFPLHYKIIQPRMSMEDWDNDFGYFYRYCTKQLMATQMNMTFVDENGVENMTNFNSLMPHAQLDTMTMIHDEAKLQGVWRVVSHRSIRMMDSFNRQDGKFFRADTLLEKNTTNDAFIIFDNSSCKLYVKKEGGAKFKKKYGRAYSLVSNRYLMMHNKLKTTAGVSQVGIDKDGYLIINVPAVQEHVKKDEYNTYFAIIEQMIFERVPNKEDE